MTQAEFNKHSSLLVSTFGAARWPPTRIAMVWTKVKDLDGDWFRKIVEEMVLKFDDRLNIAELAAQRRTSERRWDENKNSNERGEENYTSGTEYFKKLGFKDFADFLKNKNKMPQGK